MSIVSPSDDDSYICKRNRMAVASGNVYAPSHRGWDCTLPLTVQSPAKHRTVGPECNVVKAAGIDLDRRYDGSRRLALTVNVITPTDN
jgi:hypothetical protein